jgi:hypothetical protein
MLNRGLRRALRTTSPLYNTLTNFIQRTNPITLSYEKKLIQAQISGIKTSPAIFPLYPSLRTYLPEMPKRFVSPLPEYSATALAIILRDKFLDWISNFNSPKISPQTPLIKGETIPKPRVVRATQETKAPQSSPKPVEVAAKTSDSEIKKQASIERVINVSKRTLLTSIELLEQKLNIVSNAIRKKGYNPENRSMIEYLIADLDSRADREKYAPILQKARHLMEALEKLATARHEETRQTSIDGVDEDAAPLDEDAAPLDEEAAPADELVASDGASDTEDGVLVTPSDELHGAVEEVVTHNEDEEDVVVEIANGEEFNKIPEEDKLLILKAMDAAINSSTKNYVGKQSKKEDLEAIKRDFNSAADMEDQKTQLKEFIKKAMEHRTPSIFPRNESTPAQSTTASMLAFKNALGEKFNTVIALLSQPAASDEVRRPGQNI